MCVAALYLHNRNARNRTYETVVIPPTCTDSGYTLATNMLTGGTEVWDLVPATGHSFGDWQISRAGTDVEPTLFVRQCSLCGYEDVKADYPETGISVLALSGSLEGIGKKTEVPVMAALSGPEGEFDTYATVKHQGHSTLVYNKKNYTMKLYSDRERMDKLKLVFSHWNKENKYILKANYQDPSQCRNLVCADIWAEMVSSREQVPEQLKKLSNYGAVDGFPVALYHDYEFSGLYTMNLHKDDDLFGMKDDKAHAIMILNHTDGQEAFFRENARFAGDDTPWEVEFCGTEDKTWAKEHLNELIDFVQTSDDETFCRDLGKYLDVDSAVDYLIAMYALGLSEHCAKDLVLVCYGSEDPWICSMYDMEEAFDREGVMPAWDGKHWDSGTDSLLWDRIFNAYPERILERYAQLRQSVLEPQKLCKAVEDFVSAVPTQLYQADAERNGTEAHTDAHTKEMTENICGLIEQLDEIFK